jgi:hypothetical protein
MTRMFSEWFWSEASANTAAARIAKKGYKTRVSYAMRADGRHDWIVEAF